MNLLEKYLRKLNKLPEEVFLPAPDRPKIEGGEHVAAKIYSKILDDTVWVVTDPDVISLVPEGEVYYLPEEIRNLKEATEKEIKAVHKVKKSLGGLLESVLEIEII